MTVILHRREKSGPKTSSRFSKLLATRERIVHRRDLHNKANYLLSLLHL